MVKEEQEKKFICEECRREYHYKETALNCEKKDKQKKEFDNIKIFELKKEHLLLLKNVYIEWWDCEFGSPAINCKRPYGNSSVYDDIAELLKLNKKDYYDYKEEDWKEEAIDIMDKFHKETEIALQIILRNQTFALGKYKKVDRYGQDWEIIEAFH